MPFGCFRLIFNAIARSADLDRRAGRHGDPEMAHPHFAVLREFLVIGDMGVCLDDIGPGRSGGFEASGEILERLFELRPHVSWADDVAVDVARQVGFVR
jgi:hypothetical protein